MAVSPQLRVALDLAGSLEPLGDTMDDLAVALQSRELTLVPFATRRHPSRRVAAQRQFHRPLSTLWGYSRGIPIDRLLPEVDVIHVSGELVPPTSRVALVVSVDDMRSLGERRNDDHRLHQLQRSVEHGATLVATSFAARRAVMAALNLDGGVVAVAPPAVPQSLHSHDSRHLLVSVTGTAKSFVRVAPHVSAIAAQSGLGVRVLASREAGAFIRAMCPDVSVQPRTRARHELAEAHSVIHYTDGARFPSLPIAAFAAGVPVIATSTDVNRELLEGAAVLVEPDDDTTLIERVRDLVGDDHLRRILASAGEVRARDFTPESAAERYEAIYRDAVAGLR